jgi:hypothetical protein
MSLYIISSNKLILKIKALIYKKFALRMRLYPDNHIEDYFNIFLE